MTAPTSFILVLNCGSSSIKFALFELGADGRLPRRPAWNGKVQGIGGPSPDIGARDLPVMPVALDPAQPYHDALELIRQHTQRWLGGRPLRAVAHRVVHGGSKYFEPVLVDAGVLADLRSYIPLAPLHQPFALEAVDILLAERPDIPQVACFDTGFHHTLPQVEQMLPLPYAAWERGLRRYGFHGLSYEYMATALAERHGREDAERARTIVAHLGSGASLCAMRGLQSVATTMGFSALDGLMMGTRTGALDPGAVIYLMEIEKLSLAQVGRTLYHESGLLGVSGLSSDPRVLLAHEDEDSERGVRVRAALALYVRRIVREIGALVAVLGGLDRLVFTAGVGEHNAVLRTRVCAALAWLGIEIDEAANAVHAARIVTPASRVDVGVEPTNEEWVAARGALRVLG
ncbi:MAG: acetate/propionate family kinase [Hydrogenophaga sp.]|uniref:acetate/propionate family kinase n=1 Tax=Hydrogenophaga sp. TaxID=1904254 RepID=UPI000EE66ABF|nr:acetate/propionate family kinase [Hydrogenophaga sp.]MDD3785028.1 acetate/propionate family kinase [Hydrogenophaga sp.]HAJ13556.1 acetate kinase [Comamonadaceae bacterium]